MQITASAVKELRERTGAGMMECKKMLQECDGDIESAIETMRKNGLAKAAKKASRTAAEGSLAVRQSTDGKQIAIVEVNCETDFVTKNEDFQEFSGQVADAVLAQQPTDIAALNAVELPGGEAVEVTRQNLIAKIGENISVRRFELVSSEDQVGHYLHGERIGVLVAMEKGSEALLKDVAMHIAASKPICVSEDQIPADELQKEKDIFTAQAADSGKPADIIEKMVTGRIRKFVNEVTLEGQGFIKDPDTSVGKLLKDAGATVTQFVRYEVGEGIEKKEENFAEEVMAQAKG